METERNAYMVASVTKDMTEGSSIRLILGSFIPMLYGLLPQQPYNMADTIIVGKCLGAEAPAAVGSTGSINFMIIGFCLGIYNGSAIPVAQKFGEKSEKAFRRFVANSTWLVVLFSAVVTVAVCLLCRNILELIQMPGDIIDGIYSYISVIFLGIPATYLYNLLSRTIRSLGDSTTPSIFLVLSSVVNVALDFFTILVLKMGVSGTIWATTTAQVVSGILRLFYMRKKFDIPKMNDDEWGPDAYYVEIPCNMGIPTGLQYSITAIGSVILQTAVNSLGSVAVAAAMAGSKISMFFCYLFDALGSTVATYGGQNVGARKLDRIDQGLKTGAAMGYVCVAIAFAVFCIFGQWIMLMFVDEGEGEILRNTWLFLIGNNLLHTPLVSTNAVRLMTQGPGHSRLAITAGVYEMTARSFVGFCLAPVFGYITVCIASLVVWIAADLFLIPAYRHVMKNPSQLSYGRNRVADAAQ